MKKFILVLTLACMLFGNVVTAYAYDVNTYTYDKENYVLQNGDKSITWDDEARNLLDAGYEHSIYIVDDDIYLVMYDADSYLLGCNHGGTYSNLVLLASDKSVALNNTDAYVSYYTFNGTSYTKQSQAKFSYDTGLKCFAYRFTGTADNMGFLYSSLDVYGVNWNADSETFDLTGDVFFSKQISPVLHPIAEKLEAEKVLGQILKLLPMAIPLLIGFIALRKALAILQTILHQA